MRRRFVLPAAAAIALVACARVVPSGAVALVGNIEISVEDFERLVEGQLQQQEASQLLPPSTADRIQSVDRTRFAVLEQIVVDQLTIQGAGDLGLVATPEEIDQQWQTTLALTGIVDENELRGLLHEQGFSDAQIQDRLARIQLEGELSSLAEELVVVDEAAVRALYDQRLETQYTQAVTSHILVATAEEAEAIIARLASGEDFAELAMAESTDPGSGPLGGSLGSNPRGSFVEPFDSEVWAASAGDIVGPVQTDFGFHVIWVEDFVVVPFEDVADVLEGEVTGAEINARFEQLREAVLSSRDVRIDSRVGFFDLEAVLDPQRVGIVAQKPA